MRTARDTTAEDPAAYRAAVRERELRDRDALRRREERAWELAREAAALPREHFGAGRVVVFGSLVHPGWLAHWSDVVIAGWGLRPEDTLRTLGAYQAGAGDSGTRGRARGAGDERRLSSESRHRLTTRLGGPQPARLLCRTRTRL